MPRPAPTHTYLSACRLVPRRRPRPHEDGSHEDGPPPVVARFFYSSPSSIDDPLSSGDLSAVSPDAKNSRGQYRPFSAEDNYALENAWTSLICGHDRRAHLEAQQTRNSCPVPTLTAEYTARLSRIVRHLAAKHHEIHGPDHCLPDPTSLGLRPLDEPERTAPVCCQGLYRDVETELHQSFCAVARSRHNMLWVSSVILRVMEEFKRYLAPTPSQAAGPSAVNLDPENADSAHSAFHRPSSQSGRNGATHTDEPPASRPPSRRRESVPAATPSRPLPADIGMSGKPFIRVGSPNSTPASRPPSAQRASVSTSQVEPGAEAPPVRSRGYRSATQILPTERFAEGPPNGLSANVVVGVSRLHMVPLPALRMQPIYWSPVNDNAVTMRATWFYRDAMLPVPPEVANQLEAGYEELRPWTETWDDEMRCAVEVGPYGEEKISHRLWPDQMPNAAAEDHSPSSYISPFCAARCFRGEVAAEGVLGRQPIASDHDVSSSNFPPRMFANHHVIYRDRNQAFLLKPSLKPSGHYGRRPAAKIAKGGTVGVPVVRGFDEATWNKYHDSAPQEKLPGAPRARSTTSGLESSRHCPACELGREDVRISDLVLVVHGIGQKFAERVASFHFTHAINSFRRSVNLELNGPIVKEVLRDGERTRIMVLPVNWRQTLFLENGGSMTEPDKASPTPDAFGLKDIEPPTIPAVRSLMSDVMFDIPFYLSKHKTKMIHALIAEANRVYRLWCQNNPDFLEHGRVHIIAHSLGSVMALDILSNQPSYVPRLDLSSPPTSVARFEFDTTNLFLVGSPAALFLLLEQTTLMPRGGRVKPGAVPCDTTAKDVVGEAGTFGCLAVDNIYNVLAKEDPIAYLLNGTVDSAYAASLKTAYVPSTTTSFVQTMGNALRSFVFGPSPASSSPAAAQARPTTLRLPSQLELEVHDFTREDIAEKKAHLLNDNGQVDYYLRSGGGPLEIQYLNMLGAHSCYWSHVDFVRMLCMEVGRKPGRDNALPGMKAVKAATQILAPATQ